MYCFLFNVQGELLHGFSRDMANPDGFVPENGLPPHLHRRQQRLFYEILTPRDRDRFQGFCRRTHPVSAQTVPTLLLMPRDHYGALFAGRYTAQMLYHAEPIPGVTAFVLGQKTMCTLRDRYSHHHLIPTLTFASAAELYQSASPMIALLPVTVRNMLAVLTAEKELSVCPFFRSYLAEMAVTDEPSILDMAMLLPKITTCMIRSPLFSGLQIRLVLSVARQKPYTRCVLSGFLYIYMLLGYAMAMLSGDKQVEVVLLPGEENMQMQFVAEMSGRRKRMPFLVENELYTLACQYSSLAGFLTMAQYFLHRHHIAFTCAQTETRLTVSMEMSYAIQEELVFRVGDWDMQLRNTLPDVMAMLTTLVS